MTEGQYNLAKEYYERKTGKPFERLRLYQMRQWLDEALKERREQQAKIPGKSLAELQAEAAEIGRQIRKDRRIFEGYARRKAEEEK